MPAQNDVALVWPDRVIRPAAPPALVYLDLNHWIYLTRAEADPGSPPPGYDALLDAADAAASEGRAVFPLSSVHYIEMSAIADPSQRSAIATTMQRLSASNVLLGRTTLAELEIDAMLDVLLDERSTGEGIPLLGRSGAWAFGRRGGLRIALPDGSDATEALRQQLGTARLDEIMAQMHAQFEHDLLAGPADEQVPELRAAGWAPETTRQITQRRAEQEREQARRLDADPTWRRGRLRDVVSARELSMEWIEQITRATMVRGTSIGQVVDSDRDTIRRFADGMPSSRVAITLKTRYHRDGQHVWTTNDMHDIDALAIAVAYCDVVFTDKAARNALVSSSEIRALATVLPRRPQELTDYLSALPGP